MARPSKALLWAGAAGLAIVAAWAWRHFDLGALLTLDNLKASRDALQTRVQAQPLATAAAFFAVYVAGEWKRAHAPQRVLRWAEKYHAWQLA